MRFFFFFLEFPSQWILIGGNYGVTCRIDEWRQSKDRIIQIRKNSIPELNTLLLYRGISMDS